MSKNPGHTMKLRMLIIGLFMTVACFGLLIVRLYYYQLGETGDIYKEKAITQQLRSISISANRGAIFDRNGKELAFSATVWNVILVPAYITDEELPDLATGLAEILDIERDHIMEVGSDHDGPNRYYEILKKRVEDDVADQVLELASRLGTKAVTLEEDTKRYYPYGDLAAQVLGFTGDENKGAYGLEAYYNSVLSGTPGRRVSAQNAKGTDMPFRYTEMYDAKDGNSIVTTIDEVIQHYLEKHLETAVIEHGVKNGAAGVILDVTTGEVLAMATAPDFNPNEPRELGDPLKAARQAELAAALQGLDKESAAYKTAAEAYNEFVSEAQFLQWANKVITEPYEPGSVFKIVTAATALENNAVSLNDTFTCTGTHMVSGTKFGCWRAGGHGTQNFTQAIENSCNPAFIMIGARVGGESFFDFFHKFGLAEPSGIDLPGEADNKSLVQTYEKLTNKGGVELASSSFGQTNKVSVLQMANAVAAAVNGGKLYKPYVVKQIIDPDGNVVSTTQPTVIRQVISAETSETMRYLTEMVVKEGSGRNAQIPGYRIGGKTGTSEKIDLRIQTGRDENILSFVGIAPADDPKIVCLVMLDEPTLVNAFGSTIAAPVVGAVLSEVLPYMGIDPQYTAEELANLDMTLENYVGLGPHAAQEKLYKLSLKTRVVGEGGTVLKQIPAPGTTIPRGGTVVLYTDENSQGGAVTVPDVVGSSGAMANRVIVNAGLNIKIQGVDIELPGAVAVRQNPEAGQSVPPGTVVTVDFLDMTTDG